MSIPLPKKSCTLTTTRSESTENTCDSCFAWVGLSDPFKTPVKLLSCVSCKAVKYCSKASSSLLCKWRNLGSVIARCANGLLGEGIIKRSARCRHSQFPYQLTPLSMVEPLILIFEKRLLTISVVVATVKSMIAL